jgi:hypothetical protein
MVDYQQSNGARYVLIVAGALVLAGIVSFTVAMAASIF